MAKTVTDTLKELMGIRTDDSHKELTDAGWEPTDTSAKNYKKDDVELPARDALKTIRQEGKKKKDLASP